MRLFSSLILLIFITLAANGQKLQITRLELVNDQLVVHYNIDDTNPNNEYLVTLYSSKDNFAAPLTKVSGDAGQEVKPGNRKITWNICSEYGDFAGPLSVEVRANVFIPFARIKASTLNKKYKRGKNLSFEWRPGNTNPVHIELFKGSTRMSGELNHPNNGSFSTQLDKGLKPGKDYRMKITDSKTPSEFVYTENFRIKRKFPLLIKLLPIAGIAAFLGGGGGGGAETDNSLPDPSAPPTNN